MFLTPCFYTCLVCRRYSIYKPSLQGGIQKNMHSYPKIFLQLIEHIKKLPGVGKKTAERFSFQLLEWKEDDLVKFSEMLASLKKSIIPCKECGCFTEGLECPFCKRAESSSSLCIIASPKDAYAIERANTYRGYFHVLGQLISPLDGKMPEDLPLKELEKRIDALHIKEVIIALDSTLEGDATALYLHKHLKSKLIKITRLALGLPMGSSLDYVDEGTLSQAFASRQTLDRALF